MKPRDIADFLLLAALWGGSFLFMRVAAPAFGPVPLIALRVAIALLSLLPLLALRGRLGDLRARPREMLVVGVFGSALPFSLIAWAMLTLTAGFASILNAATPMFTALVAYLWLGERLSAGRMLGLLVGFAGVTALVWERVSFAGTAAASSVLLASGAALAAAFSYGVAANYIRTRLAGVDPLAVSAGSLAGATLALLPPALWWWPARLPGGEVWFSLLVLALACTGLAYVLYFRLVASAGALGATTVTFLIPVFGTLWGAIFLDETVSALMLAGGAVILLGTALTTGVLRLPAEGRRS